MAEQQNLAKLDSERQSIRGRVCPQCGGKIIPSDSAVYQSPGDPSAVFPSWQCERCGYEEVYEAKKKAALPKHTKE
jgi:predicted nucleic-acid-binding Zn-ribbon protein